MYEFDDAWNLTNEEIEEIRKIVDKELGGEYKEGGEHFRREFTKNLISAYKVVLICIRIENGEGKMFIRNKDLLAMNNAITSCSNWELRKVQMKYCECSKTKWRMDVRIIKYHLLLINDLFNQNQIGQMEYRKRFMQIFSFQVCNELVLNLLFLGYKNG